ncbi:MAG: efflux RND transporter permease subunit [Deltaproteobacteria bacterium]|nr:efflux RND transporter permease subunit [Deltaproteobacteria bacterium]
MLNSIIRFSLKHRPTILFLAGLAIVYGGWVSTRLPIDVFPDLNRPTVSVLTEAHGLAPEEVETLVTLPIETALNGTPGVTRVRSSSGVGISIVYVEFEWGTEVFRNRQLVAERLQLVKERLPEEMTPTMGPITSIMGEIQFVGLMSDDPAITPMDLRTIADWTVRPRLMTIPGISQVVVMGGQVKQYQILVSSQKMQRKRISLDELKHALSEISENTTGGFIDIDNKEFLIRPLGRVESMEEIENSLVAMHMGIPVLVKDIAEVKIGAKIKRGEASINGKHSVVLTIQKQPSASTIELTKRIEAVLTELQKTLPKGLKIESDLFKQSRFIETSVGNVKEAIRDGSIMVALILFLFLMNVRTTAITLLTIPLSLLVTAIVFKFMNLSVNTMTLGGLAIAIGELVDDAIVGVENVFRRLRENRHSKNQKNPLVVVYEASSEVRNSIIFSTIIVVLVFIPLFALGGIEGRLFAPLGVAYIISLTASLVVSVTVTPVLCSYLLPKMKVMVVNKDGLVVSYLKNLDRRILLRTINHPYIILGAGGLMLVASLCLLPFMGRNFLPEFNEGTATIGVATFPGISLASSDKLGTKIEEVMLSIPEVKSTIRRTGRAEMDEHAEGVHWHEIDVDFKEKGRSRPVVLQELREKIEKVGDVYVNIGQPISHRLDHLLSGVRAQIAIKIFGSELGELRRVGGEIQSAMKDIPGVVDLALEQIVLIPQLKMSIDRSEAAKVGIRSGTFAEEIEMALNGTTVAQFLEKQKIFDVFMRYDDRSRSDPEQIKNTLVKFLPTGQPVKISDIAEVYQGTGPNMVNREDVQRRIVVSANSHGRDLGGLIDEIRKKIAQKINLPTGYFIVYGGQFESQQQASRLLSFLGAISLLGIFVVLYIHFKSVMLSLQIMLNVPLALIGSIVAIYLTERVLSVATLIAFITLTGIATRNGIMMISHYIHLMKEEGESFTKEMVIRGSLERLVPVFMTAFSAALALVPLLASKGQPGKELLYPVAVVIVGGLISSTLLDVIVTPAVFYRFGKKAAERLIATQNNPEKEMFDEGTIHSTKRSLRGTGLCS